jgi:osmotically-inducible protein OsmY
VRRGAQHQALLNPQLEHQMQPAILAVVGLLCAPACAVAGEPAAGGPGADQPPSAAVASPRDPVLAAAQVKSALRDAAGVPRSVVVSTHADTIVLTGQVDSQLQAARALEVAGQAAAGVRVSSQIEVRAAAPEPQLTSRVREVEQALRADPRTAGLGVSVSIDDAQVIGLHGLVASAESRRVAEQVASRVPGVKRVHSHLVVPGE